MTARSINWAVLATMAFMPLLAGCSGSQSTLNPQGLEAARLAKLFWLFTGVCGAVWVIGVIAMFAAIMRRREVAPGHDPLFLDDRARATNDLCRRRAGDPNRSDSGRVHVS